MADAGTRRRYWARSLVGWRHFGAAWPNGAHRALAHLERQQGIELLVTQNVDGLHTVAGSERVVDLHGRLDLVRCMACDATVERARLQETLLDRNAQWASLTASVAPDGDVDLVVDDFSSFDVPACANCGGILKPDVVFFGENVPRRRVTAAFAALERADAMLVVGTSLMVYSGYRFAEAAAAAGKPIAAVNLGRTRADHLFTLKVESSCARALAFLLVSPDTVPSRTPVACP